MRKTRIDFEIPLVFMKEGQAFVCFSPVLDLYEHGVSYEDVYDAFKRKVLLNCGWTKIKNKLTPPRIVDRKIESIHVAV
jgi:hypothetical protein